MVNIKNILGNSRNELIVHFFSEVEQTLLDLRQAGVDCLTLGQYMQPTKRHLVLKLNNFSFCFFKIFNFVLCES